MTTHIHIRRTFIALVAVLAALALAAGSAQADFEPGFEVEGQGTNYEPTATVDSKGAAHFLWKRAGVELLTRSRAADGSFGPVKTVSATGSDYTMAADGKGAVHFVWQESNGQNIIARTRTLRPDGTFSQVTDLSALGFNASEPQVAADASGRVTFAWTRTLPGGLIVQARRMAPDGTFGQTQSISVAGQVGEQQVAMDAAGNAVIVWTRLEGSSYIAETRRWAVNGSFGPIMQATTTGEHAAQPRVAFDGAGNAHFAIVRGLGLQTRHMGPDGTLSAVQDVRANVKDQARNPSLAVQPDGTVQIAWRCTCYVEDGVIQTQRRFPNGSFGGVRTLGEYTNSMIAMPQTAFDTDGNAHHTWVTTVGDDDVVLSRPQRADGSLGPVQQLSESVQGPDGIVSSVAPMSGAHGRPVVAWTRTKGTNVPVEGALLASPAAGGGGGGGTGGGGGGTGTGPVLDLTPPELSALALKPGRLAIGRRGRVGYALSESASVRIRVARRRAGRLRFLKGALRQRGHAGRNRLTFPGRLRGRPLKPGRYVLVAVATDAAGNASSRRRAAFRVVTPRR